MIWLTVGVCSIFVLHFNPAIAVEPEPIEAGLRRINNYFARRHPHDLQPDEAIELAQIWLDSGSASDTPVEALKLFLSLAKLDDESSCNAEGLKIIVEYNTAIGSFENIRAMTHRVGFYYFLRHAQICLKQYYHLLDGVMSGLANTDIERVEKFANYVGAKDNYFIKDYIRYFSSSGLQLDFIKGIVNSGDDFEAKANEMQDVLSVLANIDELPNDLESLERIFDEFVYEPCERFVQALGPDIYDPLMRDYETLLSFPRRDGRKLFSDPDCSKIDYYCSLSYVKLCRVFALEIDKEALLNSMLEVQ